MPDVYKGDEPYIFVSYAHADDDAVLPLLEALVAEGYRVWWDKGIELAAPFPDYIADHVHDCACFVPLMSASSLRSNWCNSEVYYALELGKRILPIYLEDIELPRGLHMHLCYRQHLARSEFETDTAMYRELFAAKVFDPCLTREGVRRRGAKRRDPQPMETESRAETRAVVSPIGQAATVRNGVAPSVEHRDSIADYSWDELKELSRAIAAAVSDAEGLEIAKAYHLIDEDGRLRGETKAITLKDGTRTSIRILGFRHDNLAGGGKAGISFEFADVPARHSMNPDWANEGGCEASEMRGWLNDGRAGFLSLLPDELRPLVETAAKRTNNRGRVRENDTSCVTATDDRLWLLSMSEVYGRLSAQGENVPWSPATYDAEGEQYKLYADRGVSTSSYGFCRKRGASSWWWLRSPSAIGTLWFHLVNNGGGWLRDNADNEWGVSPGFCF